MKGTNKKMRRKLTDLLGLKGIPYSRKIEIMSEFLQRVAGSRKQAVVKAPCGAGKTLCGTAYAAASATPQFPVIMILQDRRTMFNVRGDLSLIMNPEHIGVYAGWNEAECHGLNHGNLTYRDCLREASDSACLRCTGSWNCNYWQSGRQLGRRLVVTTRASFFQLCEKGHDFSQHLIICDEDLMTFIDETFTADELDTLYRVLGRYDAFSDIARLLRDLFPSLMFSHFRGIDRTPDTHVRFMTQAGWDRSVTGRIIKFIKADPGAMKQYEELVFRLLVFFRTCAECASNYAYYYDGRNLYVKKQRINLRAFTGYRQFIVLNASAALSLNEFAPGTDIVTCDELDKYRDESSVDLYVVASNPTVSRRSSNITRGLSMLGLNATCFFAGGPDVLLPFNASNGDEDADIAEHGIRREYRSHAGADANVHRISRGRLRGYNEFRNCTSAFFVAAGFFTSITDCVLHAVLRTGTDMAWTEVVRNRRPVMHKGRFVNADVQDVYMRKTLDEIHQGVFRTAIRDGRDIQAIIALPSAEWLVPLRMLMKFKVVEAEHPCPQTVKAFLGLSQLMNLAPGTVVGKREAAAILGYDGETGWHDHRNRISSLLESYFEIPHTGYGMVRRDIA